MKKLHFHRLKREMREQQNKLIDQIETEAMNRWTVSPEDMKKGIWWKTNRNYKIIKSCFTPTPTPLPPPVISSTPEERNRKTHQL